MKFYEILFFVCFAGLFFVVFMAVGDLMEAREEKRLAEQSADEAWQELQMLRASIANGVPITF